MTLLELLQKDRTCRGYDGSYPVTEETLRGLIDHTRFGAATGNRQPLAYYPVTAPEEVAAVMDNIKWAGSLPQLQLPHPGMAPTAFVVMCIDTEISPNPKAYKEDVGICAQILTLAATEQGLGCCMFLSFVPEKLSAALGLPARYVPALVLAVGKPKEAVRLVEAKEGAVTYYRDEQDVHYVPKRPLEEVIIKK